MECQNIKPQHYHRGSNFYFLPAGRQARTATRRRRAVAGKTRAG